MIRRPPRSTQSRSSAASDVYKRQRLMRRESMTFVEFLIMVCLVVYWLGVLVFIIAEDREPATTLLWLLFIIVLPLFGLIFYFFFGRDWRALARRHKRYAKFRALANEALPPIYKRYSGLQQKLKERYAG